MSTSPTFGVEEEFLLVDLQLELTSCQVETTSSVASSSAELSAELARLRGVSAAAAVDSGARLLAVALPPTVPPEFPITDTPRYRAIAERFGMIAHEQGICGCHVHVEVPNRELAVRVSNRLRPWLPILLALSANSAVYRNADSGHASWRSVLWARWPSAGPPPHFDSADDYDAMIKIMMDAGAMVDDGMVYWDVRPSANFPTVEVRVADVPSTVAETVLLATLIRALVMTALEDERRGEPVLPLTPHTLSVAYWKAARDGLDGSAIDLTDTHALVPVTRLLHGLIDRVTPALRALGDDEFVRSELDRVAAEGNGAMRQRRAWARRNDVSDVIEAATAATLFGV